MTKRAELTRRDFLTGALRAAPSRFGWEQKAGIGRDPAAPPGAPAREEAIQRVLEQLHDLTGIEEP